MAEPPAAGPTAASPSGKVLSACSSNLPVHLSPCVVSARQAQSPVRTSTSGAADLSVDSSRTVPGAGAAHGPSRSPQALPNAVACSPSSSWSFQRDGHTLQPTRPFCLEVCAGSCRLTASLRRFGLDAWGIDHKGGKLAPESPAVLFLDLTLASDAAALQKLLDHPLLVYVHFSPPCGTCSRARDRPLPGAVGGGPPPVRSVDFPLGFTDLAVRLPSLLPRVQAANQIYRVIFEAIGGLLHRKVAWSVENPRNSLLWYIPFVRDVIAKPMVKEVQFQHCMYGGARDKWTSFWFYPAGLLDGLRRVCDGSHVHDAWGRAVDGSFRTALETVYPQALCDSIVTHVTTYLKLVKAPPLPVSRARNEPLPKRPRDDRVSAGFQPRGAKSRRLLPEFRATFTIVGDFAASDARCRVGHRWQSGVVFGVHVPPLSQTIKVTYRDSDAAALVNHSGASDLVPQMVVPTRACIRDVGMTRFEADDVYIGREFKDRSGRVLSASAWANPFRLRDCKDLDECLGRFDSYLHASPRLMDKLQELSGKRLICHCRKGAPCHADTIARAFRQAFASEAPACSVTVGVYFGPEEFVAAAERCRHPFEALVLPAPLETSIRFRMTAPLKHIVATRHDALKFWLGRASALVRREVQLHGALHQEVKSILSDKRVLVFSEMLDHLGFPRRADLIHFMVSGFPVVGAYPRTDIFPAAERKAIYAPEDLWRLSRRLRKDLAAVPGGSREPALDEEVWATSLEEVRRGWLLEPTDEETLDRTLGCWIPSRRFGIRQSKKIRVIDDFAASLVNDALSAEETVDPDGLDRIAVNAKAHLDAFTAPASLRPPSSPFASDVRHADHAEARLVSRLWDVASAYRHLARAPKHGSFTVIAVWNPFKKEFVYFQQPALAFGAAASVFSFNWVAAALREILVGIFHIGATNFYDDFSVIEVEALAADARSCVESVFELLGWKLKPLSEFGELSEPLGAVLDLSRCREGLAVLKNREARVQEIVASIDALKAEGTISGDLVPKLRGRLLFSRSLCFGRFGGNALRALASACAVGRRRLVVEGELARALSHLRAHLLEAKPREIRLHHDQCPILLTDGAFEPGPDGRAVGGIGAVLLDPVDRSYSFFQAVVAGRDMEAFLANGALTVIMELEILPVLLSRLVWRHRLQHRSHLSFVDNDGAKCGLVAGYSANAVACELISRVAAADISMAALPWYDRVPSLSNLADAPSRGVAPAALVGWAAPVRVECAVQLRDALGAVFGGLRAPAVRGPRSSEL